MCTDLPRKLPRACHFLPPVEVAEVAGAEAEETSAICSLPSILEADPQPRRTHSAPRTHWALQRHSLEAGHSPLWAEALASRMESAESLEVQR